MRPKERQPSVTAALSRRSFLGLSAAYSASVQWPSMGLADESKYASNQVPRDLPLAAAAPSNQEWLRHAITLQPWGATEFKALTELPQLPGQLKSEFGFNAIILLPTEAHNALSNAILPLNDPGRRLNDPALLLTDAQFRAGLSAYKQEGYRLILYSSVMHCGHAPIWQSGQLGREHPDWLQRDALGKTIGAFGQAWLCPSSPARAYTLDYTLKLVRDYAPDGIMLDNNGFGHTAEGFTCYCEHCQQSFKQYVIERCGEVFIRSAIQTNPEQLRIPVDKGPLLPLWLCWRSRVWAQSNELFRSALRKLRPEIAFFVNIQYDQNPDTQGSRQQFTHEDVIFSETHESDSWYVSQKLVLGQALTQGRLPLWNYLATFQDKNPLRLRTPLEVSLMIATSLAHLALPWINYPGLDSIEDLQSRREIARYVSWFASHQELFSGNLSSPVGSVVSLLTRDVFESIKNCNRQGVTGCSASEDTPSLITRHVGLLLKAGMPVIAIREEDLTQAALNPIRILILPGTKILAQDRAEVIASWVRSGGILVAASNSGEYDELGSKRPQSTLWRALGLGNSPGAFQRVGLGSVLLPAASSFDEDTLKHVQAAELQFSVPQGTEVVCAETTHRYFLHIVLHEVANNNASSIQLPRWLSPREGVHRWYSPDWDGPKEIIYRPGRPVDIADHPIYSVIALDR